MRNACSNAGLSHASLSSFWSRRPSRSQNCCRYGGSVRMKSTQLSGSIFISTSESACCRRSVSERGKRWSNRWSMMLLRFCPSRGRETGDGACSQGRGLLFRGDRLRGEPKPGGRAFSYDACTVQADVVLGYEREAEGRRPQGAGVLPGARARVTGRNGARQREIVPAVP